MAKRLRVLIAEDDKGDLELMKVVIEGLGLTEETAAVRDGAEVLDFLFRRGLYADRPSGGPALLFLDLKLPKIDGIEVLNQIRKKEEFKAMRTVIFSSSLDESDRKRSLAAGADAFLVKPIDFDQFQEAISSAVQTHAFPEKRPSGTEQDS